MATVIGEKFNGTRKTITNAWDQTSGSTGGYIARTSGITIDYEVNDATDADDAVDSVYSYIRDTLGAIQLDGMTLQTVTVREEQGIGWFIVSANYSASSGSGSQGGDGGDTFAFDTTGGTAHITQSLETVLAKWQGLTDPAHRGAIGDDGENVAGVDIIVPQYQFSVTIWKDDTEVTQSYKLQVNDLTGTVNDALFEGFDAGEVLFLGARGNRAQGSDIWQIEFTFAGKKNQTNITVGDYTIIEKKGWDYLWIRYGSKVVLDDALPSRVIQIPTSVYVERVYEDGDFSLLGL